MWGIKKIAEILFIALALFIIVVIISGYGTLLKESIMGFLGFETELEITHEENIQAEKEFENLLNHIEKCENFRDIICGCTFNTKNFNEKHMILATKDELRLMNIRNLYKNDIIKDEYAGILIKKGDVKNINCYFDKNLKKIDVNIARIFFDKKKLYLYEKRGGFLVKNEIQKEVKK